MHLHSGQHTHPTLHMHTGQHVLQASTHIQDCTCMQPSTCMQDGTRVQQGTWAGTHVGTRMPVGAHVLPAGSGGAVNGNLSAWPYSSTAAAPAPRLMPPPPAPPAVPPHTHVASGSHARMGLCFLQCACRLPNNAHYCPPLLPLCAANVAPMRVPL
jgi:hypothetical protein